VATNQNIPLVVRDSPGIKRACQIGLESLSCLLVLVSLTVFPFFRGGTLDYVWLSAAGVLTFALAVLLAAHAVGRKSIKFSSLARLVTAFVIAQLCWILLRSFIPLGSLVSVFGNKAALLAPEAVPVYVLKHFFYLTVFIWTYLYVNTRRRLSLAIWFMLLITVCQAIIGIISSRMGLHLVPPEYLDGHWSFARGTFINRNHFAAFIGIGVSLCIASFMAASNIGYFSSEPSTDDTAFNRIMRLLNYMLKEGALLTVFLLLLVYGVLLSGSRGGFIAPLISLSILGINFFHGIKLLKFCTGIIFLVVIIYVLSVLVGEAESLVNNFVALYENNGRIFIWKALFPIAYDHWFWGVGVGGFVANFELYRPADFTQLQLFQAHSEFLHLVIEQGVIGLILWVYPIFIVLRALWGKTKTTSSKFARKMCLLCAAVMGTLLVHSVWEVHLQQPAISAYFYVFLALGIVSTEINRKSKSTRV
jgi:O-antigen ligase